jgi:orotidine-5'-phosphate decarboxylase
MTNPLCLALDTPDVDRAIHVARALKNHVGFLKVGMEFFYAHGAKAYEAVAREGLPIFLDLKLHDIPNTVEQGLRSLMQLAPAPAIVNVHATGGFAMMQAARKAVPASTKLIAVTVLTSLSDADVYDVGFVRDTQGLARKLALLAKSAGLDGVVCSPHDIKAIKADCGSDFYTVVPGIRPADAATGDQKRVATPRAAIEAGADILVIGRAITGAADPVRAAREILESLV